MGRREGGQGEKGGREGWRNDGGECKRDVKDERKLRTKKKGEEMQEIKTKKYWINGQREAICETKFKKIISIRMIKGKKMWNEGNGKVKCKDSGKIMR